MKTQKSKYHLWGIKKSGRRGKQGNNFINYHQTWDYIRECLNDRSAIRGIDTRLYSQLEVREENTGKAVKTFMSEDD